MEINRSQPRILTPNQVSRASSVKRQEWTLDLGKMPKTHRTQRTDALNDLIEHGIIPEGKYAIDDLVRECLELEEWKLLGAIQENCPLQFFVLSAINEEKMRQFCLGLPSTTPLSKLLIRGHMDEGMVVALGELMEKAPLLSNLLLDLECNESTYRRLAEELKRQTNLTSLSVAADAAGPIELQFIKNVLKGKPDLRGFEVKADEYMRIDPDIVGEILKALRDGDSALNYLGLKGCEFTTPEEGKLVEILNTTATLKDLSLESSYFEYDSKFFDHALIRNRTVKSLNLGNCGYSGEAPLGKLLQDKGLCRLDLSLFDARVSGDLAIKNVASELKNNTSLTCLSLDASHLDPRYEEVAWLPALCEAIEVNTTLTDLILPGNLKLDQFRSLADSVNKNETLEIFRFTSYGPPTSEETREIMEKIQNHVAGNSRLRIAAFAQGGFRAIFDATLDEHGVRLDDELIGYTAEAASRSMGRSAATVSLVNKRAAELGKMALDDWDARNRPPGSQ